MICSSCQTQLPEEAVACWKCGEALQPTTGLPVPVRRSDAARAHSGGFRRIRDGLAQADPLLVVLTLLFNAAFFICFGWAVPFTIWGNIVELSKQYPEWSALLEIASTSTLLVSAVTFFIGTWWGEYQLIHRLYTVGESR